MVTPQKRGRVRRKPETLNIAAARARLAELVERAASGEEIILARNGKPKAKLVPVAAKAAYVYGAGKGLCKGTESVLNEPLPDDVRVDSVNERASMI